MLQTIIECLIDARRSQQKALPAWLKWCVSRSQRLQRFDHQACNLNRRLRGQPELSVQAFEMLHGLAGKGGRGAASRFGIASWRWGVAAALCVLLVASVGVWQGLSGQEAGTPMAKHTGDGLHPGQVEVVNQWAAALGDWAHAGHANASGDPIAKQMEAWGASGEAWLNRWESGMEAAWVGDTARVQNPVVAAAAAWAQGVPKVAVGNPVVVMETHTQGLGNQANRWAAAVFDDTPKQLARLTQAINQRAVQPESSGPGEQANPVSM